MKALRLFLPALLLASCGVPDPAATNDAAYSALGAGDYFSAQILFEEALAAMAPTDPLHLQASVGRCRALAHRDGAAARTAFVTLAQANDAISDKDYSMLVSELTDAGNLIEAIELLDQGLSRYPENQRLSAIKVRVVAESQKPGNDAAMDKLKGLGYL
jgi:tetratricopeptide (TPR) repeat protein